MLGDWVKKTEGIKQRKILTDTDTIVIIRGKGWQREVEECKGCINGNR